MDVELDQKKEMETSGESKGMNRLMAAVNLSFSFRTPSIVNPSKRRKRAPMES